MVVIDHLLCEIRFRSYPKFRDRILLKGLDCSDPNIISGIYTILIRIKNKSFYDLSNSIGVFKIIEFQWHFGNFDQFG